MDDEITHYMHAAANNKARADLANAAADAAAEAVGAMAEKVSELLSRERTLVATIELFSDIGDLCAAERDRLRETNESLVATYQGLFNERDRLRAVVDALRGFLFIEDEFEPADNAVDVIADLRTMLAELDVSPTGEDT